MTQIETQQSSPEDILAKEIGFLEVTLKSIQIRLAELYDELRRFEKPDTRVAEKYREKK